MSPPGRPKGAYRSAKHEGTPVSVRGHTLALTAALFGWLSPASQAAALAPCRLKGVEYEAQCGSLLRPLDPAAPRGRQIELHYAVLPAVARNKAADPVFLLAGGPGQSAIDLAGPLARLLHRLNNRRDIVLVDQRGTGRSAPLHCDMPPPTAPLNEGGDGAQAALMARCLQALPKLAHVGEAAGLRHFTTPVAMADLDAVRRALGAPSINLIGVSYGTRAALEYQRQFPAAVRRMVLDGVAPADMVLPASFAADNQAALDGLLDWCEGDRACAAAHPGLRAAWQRLLARAPHDVKVAHPFTGTTQALTLTRDALQGLVRAPLYVPQLAAALPQAIRSADAGHFEALFGLASALGSARKGDTELAHGMHFSVICAEDVPRLPPQLAGEAASTALYRQVCADWPRGELPAAFYTLAPSTAATLVLSGGIDPATPPRHGARVTAALGPKARHEVVPHAGHGVMSLPCLRDGVYRFINAAGDDDALAVELGCAKAMPRPPAFVPIVVPSLAPVQPAVKP